MSIVLPVAMSIVKVIDMVIVLYGLMTTSWTVDVFLMAFVRLMGHRKLLYDCFPEGLYPLPAPLWRQGGVPVKVARKRNRSAHKMVDPPGTPQSAGEATKSLRSLCREWSQPCGYER